MPTLRNLLIACTVALLLAPSAARAQSQTRASAKPMQRFGCYVGYQEDRCSEHLRILATELSAYPLELLGEWTWVLVRSEDWKAIVRSKGGDVDSPAFSLLDKHYTILEEALFTHVPRRSPDLLRKWQIPLDILLKHAVSHELAHAMCNEESEYDAEENGKLLRMHRPVRCRGVPR